ncbi:MAG: SpoIID/LytB domain-containing protein [Oscillospiraceae bacterium]|nr:SpoIID/LytB domain-containing protein [Oscillospiraceae bacterium]
MKLRAVLNGIAALCAIGVFYTFAFCMVDDASDSEISKEYYFNTATEPTEEETEASVLKEEAPLNISGVSGNDINIAYLPDNSDNERVSSHIQSTPSYQAAPDSSSEESTIPAATPLYTAAEVTTEVPVSADENTATESAGADTAATAPEPVDDMNYDTVPEDTDLDIVVSENNLGEAVIENNNALAEEDFASPDLLSELDKKPSQEEIMRKLGEMQSEYNTQTTPMTTPVTTDFWSSYYPAETTTITSSGTYFETVPSFSEPVSSETELTTTTPEGTEIVTARFDGSVQEINAYDLVCMIVSTEMSPSFNQEALKAQAVAAYSYVKYHNVNGLIPSVLVKHDIPNEVRQAVDSVFGKCCYYNGSPAQTVYTASSAGTTASAENVWGGNPVPYLTSVATPFDVASDPNYGVISTFSESYIRNAFESYLGITLSDDPANWLTVTGRIDGNYVSSVNVDGQVTVSGRKIRENILKFGIKSWCFDVSYADGEFTFVTYGYGHGVGMSQNGANILAKQGYTYDQILQYYFPGTTIN